MSTAHGLLVVLTGNGKGKTTSALGMLVRASGHQMKPAVIQFIKKNPEALGEYRWARQHDILWKNFGTGFLWEEKNMEHAKNRALEGIAYAEQLVIQGNIDVLILDELTYVFSMKWADEAEFLNRIRTQKPPGMHIVITGRNASEQLIAAADLVTEMVEVKHPYHTDGLGAQQGIEY